MHTSVNGERDSTGIQRAHGRRHPRLLPIRNQSPERYRLYASVGGAHLIRFLVDECTGPAVASWLRDQNNDVFSVFDEARGMDDEANECAPTTRCS
jgi:hypothetical protein